LSARRISRQGNRGVMADTKPKLEMNILALDQGFPCLIGHRWRNNTASNKYAAEVGNPIQKNDAKSAVSNKTAQQVAIASSMITPE